MVELANLASLPHQTRLQVFGRFWTIFVQNFCLIVIVYNFPLGLKRFELFELLKYLSLM